MSKATLIIGRLQTKATPITHRKRHKWREHAMDSSSRCSSYQPMLYRLTER